MQPENQRFVFQILTRISQGLALPYLQIIYDPRVILPLGLTYPDQIGSKTKDQCGNENSQFIRWYSTVTQAEDCLHNGTFPLPLPHGSPCPPSHNASAGGQGTLGKGLDMTVGSSSGKRNSEGN